MNNLTYSNNGLHLTEQFEGYAPRAYRDMRGRLTIGYGHTGEDVVEGLEWTQEMADRALAADIAWAAAVVNAHVSYGLKQGEFDALVDFVFNVGSGHFLGSTMLSYLNAGDLEQAVGQFEQWANAGGMRVAGLLRRRLAEAKEFVS